VTIMLRLQPETPADIDAIDAIHRAAFPGPHETELVRALRQADRAAVSILARLDGEAVGHVMLSPVELAGVCAAGGGLALSPLAVTPTFQGRGIGGWLVAESLAAARRRGARFIVLVGEPGYYGRLGFEPARTYGLANQYGIIDAFMVRPLSSGALPPEGGLIRYAPEFDALGARGDFQ
jgi:putative acetyltransferase